MAFNMSSRHDFNLPNYYSKIKIPNFNASNLYKEHTITYTQTTYQRIPIPVYGVVVLIKIILFICCCKCCKKSKTVNVDQNVLIRDEQTNVNAPVVVTSSTHVPPNAGVNYPVDEPVRGYQTAHTPYSQPSYPMPQPAPVHTGVPYPINNTGMPMPQTNTPYPPAQPVGYQAPYPPAQNPQDVLPPSYDQVVGTTGPASAPYNKQAPYNPHYTGN
ncbi:protein shisa-5 isoform X5 [Condylostylus longicornis]|uniref:protein shisa-5 isoform X5 n=1 Tax=Condylostylus longicornis TaxID=2530218 RepID=UPI00244E2825|nr:protein shisa-5 isoform X5 [Condylostylus longicornis]